MTFLEGDQEVSLCDILVSRKTVYLVTGSACDLRSGRYIARLQLISEQNVTFCATQGCTNPRVIFILGRRGATPFFVHSQQAGAGAQGVYTIGRSLGRVSFSG